MRLDSLDVGILPISSSPFWCLAPSKRGISGNQSSESSFNINFPLEQCEVCSQKHGGGNGEKVPTSRSRPSRSRSSHSWWLLAAGAISLKDAACAPGPSGLSLHRPSPCRIRCCPVDESQHCCASGHGDRRRFGTGHHANALLLSYSFSPSWLDYLPTPHRLAMCSCIHVQVFLCAWMCA